MMLYFFLEFFVMLNILNNLKLKFVDIILQIYFSVLMLNLQRTVNFWIINNKLFEAYSNLAYTYSLKYMCIQQYTICAQCQQFNALIFSLAQHNCSLFTCRSTYFSYLFVNLQEHIFQLFICKVVGALILVIYL